MPVRIVVFQLESLEPRMFSFNSPFGACPECDGLGSKLEVDVDLVIPNKDLIIKTACDCPMGANKFAILSAVA